jgi:hypothetical protein
LSGPYLRWPKVKACAILDIMPSWALFGRRPGLT